MKYFILPVVLIALLSPCHSVLSQNTNEIEIKKVSDKEKQEQLSNKIEAQNKASRATKATFEWYNSF